MWATYPKIEDALQLIKAWGFTYKSIAFQWVKLNRGAKVDNLQIVTIKDLLKASCFLGLEDGRAGIQSVVCWRLRESRSG